MDGVVISDSGGPSPVSKVKNEPVKVFSPSVVKFLVCC